MSKSVMICLWQACLFVLPLVSVYLLDIYFSYDVLKTIFTFFIGNLIFLIGGASTQSNRILRSVECFDTEAKTWVSGVKDLPYPSKWVKCLSFD